MLVLKLYLIRIIKKNKYHIKSRFKKNPNKFLVEQTK